MFDAMTPADPYWFNASDTRAADRAAVRVALAMTAAVMVFTLAAVIGLSAAFPPGDDAPPFWGTEPMPLV